MGLLLLEQVDPHHAHPLHHHSGGAHSEASHRQAAHPIGHMALLSFRDSVAALPIDHMVLLSFRDSVAATPWVTWNCSVYGTMTAYCTLY